MRHNGGEARIRVAAGLHQLRVEAGLSTYQLAARMGLSQSKVTRMETARSGAPVVDVEAWAAATSADPTRAALLIEQAERARIEAIALRRGGPREPAAGGGPGAGGAGGDDGDSIGGDRGGRGLAEEADQLERTAGLMLIYQPLAIPDLLQTAEYARRELRARQAGGPAEISAAVAARVARQAVLFDDSKRLEVILGEPALRWRAGPPTVQLAQLDRIRTLATLTNVAIGVLPLSAQMPAAWHGFAIYEERSQGGAMALVETVGQVLKVTQEPELDRYREAFAQLWTSALHDEPAMALVADVMAGVSPTVHRT